MRIERHGHITTIADGQHVMLVNRLATGLVSTVFTVLALREAYLIMTGALQDLVRFAIAVSGALISLLVFLYFMRSPRTVVTIDHEHRQIVIARIGMYGRTEETFLRFDDIAKVTVEGSSTDPDCFVKIWPYKSAPITLSRYGTYASCAQDAAAALEATRHKPVVI